MRGHVAVVVAEVVIVAAEAVLAALLLAVATARIR